MTRFILASVVATLALADTSDIYAEPPGTVLGCECVGQCQVGLLFECNAAPVCKVKSKNCAKGTAERSITMGSYYDYCVYGQYPTYEAMTASEKKDIVLKHLHADTASSTYPNLLNVLTGIMGESVRVTFDSSSDVFPETRKKWIHTVGVTGGIRWESTGDHEYTGLFTGAEHGLVRLSSAKATSGGVAPGMGIKLFRDGRPSSNFVAMFSLDGQPCEDTDFFTHKWSNHISNTDNFGLKLIAAKFWQASYCPLMVGLSDMSSGSDSKAGKFPFQLQFQALVKSDCPCKDYAKCLANLVSNVAVGTKIFEVSALAQPGAAAKVIGHITLTDALTTSKFGDEQLFFKHQHMEDDFALQPAWRAALNLKDQCGMGCAGEKVPPIAKGCSSPFNGTQTARDGMLQTDTQVASTNYTVGFVISGTHNPSISGPYVVTPAQVCNGLPTYQNINTGLWLWQQDGYKYWHVGSGAQAAVCGHMDPIYLTSERFCQSRPDGPGCANQWHEYPAGNGLPDGNCPGKHCPINPAVKVVAVGGGVVEAIQV